jgi:hypothetical protein
MHLTHHYQVATHNFSISAGADSFLWERMRGCYGPFVVYEGGDSRFALQVVDEVDLEGGELVYSNMDDVQPWFITLNVYKSSTGHFFEITQPSSSEVNGRLFIDFALRNARLYLMGTEAQQWNTFTTAVDLCYLLSTACHDTLLMHASAVIYEGHAYLFLGKSGTGKSTHSRMWLETLEGAELMNDDHPVLRVESDGTVVAYGSPWSGKTPCYKNMKAPVGGIVRIARAPYNQAVRLSPFQAYASLLTSSSGMTWERELADGRDNTLQKIASCVPCWKMECLPDHAAAYVCADAVVV